MSQSLECVRVKDPLLMLESKLQFGVLESASSVEFQRFPAAGDSSSSIIINAQMPNTSTVISRDASLTSTITYTISGTVPVNGYLIEYPHNICFAPFPLAQSITNANLQINSASSTANVNQILDPILRGVSKEEMVRWASTTPTQLDTFGNYIQLGFINPLLSPFTGIENATDVYNVPRGAFPAYILGNTQNTTQAARVQTATIQITVSEPIFVSPFLFSQPADKPGLVGVGQIILNLQMDSLARRALRFIDLDGKSSGLSVTDVVYSNTYLDLKLLTPKVSDLIPLNTVVDMMQYQNWVRPPTETLNAGASTTITSQAISLNCYPDLVVVYVRDKQANLTNYTPDVYATITNINITCDNRSGLLSTFTPQELFKTSYKSGSQQNYYGFSGLSNGWYADNSNQNGASISSEGSVFYCAFGTEISIPLDYYAPGSLTTTQFQATVKVQNNTGSTMQPELNLLFINSGLMLSSNGSSQTFTNGVLSKQMVLDTLQQRPVNKHSISRYVGGSFLSNVKSFVHKALPMVKTALQNVGPLAEKGAKALSDMGYGATGGAMTGGAETGGRRGVRHRVM